MKRGIIANTGKINRTDKDTISIQSNLNNSDINYYLLYWDKIVLPTNNIFHQTIPYEEDLINSGILERPRVQFSNWSTDIENGFFDLFITAQSQVANDLLGKKGDTDWVIHQIGKEIIISSQQQREFQSLKVELYNCLPVPYDSIHPDIILNFKEKRKTEFEQLHKTIDEFYFDILKSPDQDFKRKIVNSELEKAIINVQKISSEKFQKSTKYNFVTELNLDLKDIISSSALGYILDTFCFQVGYPIGTLASGIFSCVNLKINRTTSVEASKDKQKLSFLAEAVKTNILK